VKTIGLIGGMSWESTIEYYRIINESIRDKLGGHNSAKILMYSFNFEDILPHKSDPNIVEKMLVERAKNMERCGAECVAICTNTMHIFAPEVQKNISIPLLNIVDATAKIIQNKNIKKVSLLGSLMTMEKDFYKTKLTSDYGIDVLIPDENDRKLVNEIIFDELCVGERNESSRRHFLRIIKYLIERGSEGIILGCTEIPLLIKNADIQVPLFDTTAIHARYAADFALNE